MLYDLSKPRAQSLIGLVVGAKNKKSQLPQSIVLRRGARKCRRKFETQSTDQSIYVCIVIGNIHEHWLRDF